MDVAAVARAHPAWPLAANLGTARAQDRLLMRTARGPGGGLTSVASRATDTTPPRITPAPTDVAGVDVQRIALDRIESLSARLAQREQRRAERERDAAGTALTAEIRKLEAQRDTRIAELEATCRRDWRARIRDIEMKQAVNEAQAASLAAGTPEHVEQERQRLRAALDEARAALRAEIAAGRASAEAAFRSASEALVAQSVRTLAAGAAARNQAAEARLAEYRQEVTSSLRSHRPAGPTTAPIANGPRPVAAAVRSRPLAAPAPVSAARLASVDSRALVARIYEEARRQVMREATRRGWSVRLTRDGVAEDETETVRSAVTAAWRSAGRFASEDRGRRSRVEAGSGGNGER